MQKNQRKEFCYVTYQSMVESGGETYNLVTMIKEYVTDRKD